MTTQFCGFAVALSIVAGLPAATPNYNPGTVTVFNIYTNYGYGSPGPLLEVSPGNFVGIAGFSNPSPTAFLLTSQGAISTIYGFTTGAPGGAILQAVNGRIYGSQQSPNAEFSFDLAGNFQTYPLTPLLVLALRSVAQRQTLRHRMELHRRQFLRRNDSRWRHHHPPHLYRT